MIDTNKESLTINKLIYEKEEIIFLEDDMIVPDSKPDILSAIETCGNICIYKKELMDEKLKIDGNVNAYVMYLADSLEDTIRGININLDFSKILDAPKCKDEMILDVTTKINNIECNVINGRKINVKAEVSVKFKVYNNENIELINDIVDNSDIQILRKQIDVNSLVGYGSTKAYVKETIVIDNTDNLAEILKAKVDLTDIDIKTSYNKVLAKADANVKIVYLTEENKIQSCNNKLPIVGFIDIPNVSEDNVCDTNFEIRNMIIKPNGVDEHSIYVELELGVTCMAYEVKNVNQLQDIYSPVQEVKCNKKKFSMISDKENRREKCHINETIKIQEIQDYNILDVDCIPKVINMNKLGSKIQYEGEIELLFLLETPELQVATSRAVVPFEHLVDDVQDAENLDIATSIEVENTDFVIKTGGDVAADLNIIINTNINKKQDIDIIESIETEENINYEDYSLVIYIVKPGDTLWKIAKTLRSTIEDIKKANAIEDENKITPGDKLYIPRYVKYA